MPTYDGIGSSVTHEIEVVGDVFISNVEGGSLSTQVPFEIFSNVSGMVSPPTDSRQLRLRVQSNVETNVANSYVTDMGIQNTTDNYFFITAPQNTTNVGDQNTFVISKTSNVGIGTTNPEKPLHVVGDSWITGTLTASNIIGASPVTISSSIVMAAGTTLTTGAIEPPSGVDSNMNVTGTLTTSNITHASEVTLTSNLLMGSDKTLTTSNIVARTDENLLISSNLEVGTSNLFVNTANGNVGIGKTNPNIHLDVGNALTNPKIGRFINTPSVHAADKRDTVYLGRWDVNINEFAGMAVNVADFTSAGYGNCGNQATIKFYTWGCNYSGSREVMSILGSGTVVINTLDVTNSGSTSNYLKIRSYMNDNSTRSVSGLKFWSNPQFGNGDNGQRNSAWINTGFYNGSWATYMSLHTRSGAGSGTAQQPIMCKQGAVGINNVNTPSYTLHVNGSLYYSSGGLNGSDDRIKYKEENIPNTLALISQLKPQKYEKIMEIPKDSEGNWIPTDEEWESVKQDYTYGDEFGFIAQDVRNIPELSFLVNGEETRTDTKTLNHEEYSNLTTDQQNTYTLSYISKNGTITLEEYSNLTTDEQEVYTAHYTKEIETQTPLALNYQGLFVVAIGAIQELKTKNDALETQLASLLSRIESLENSS